MRDFIKRNSPPGVDASLLNRIFIFGNIVSFAMGMIVFLMRYYSAYSALLSYDIPGKTTIIKGAVISSFSFIISNSMIGFAITAVCCLSFIPYYIFHYQNGSMSIYLMKRLPQRSELLKSIITVPIMFCAITLVFAVVSVGICFAIYALVTPSACLPQELFS